MLMVTTKRLLQIRKDNKMGESKGSSKIEIDYLLLFTEGYLLKNSLSRTRGRIIMIPILNNTVRLKSRKHIFCSFYTPASFISIIALYLWYQSNFSVLILLACFRPQVGGRSCCKCSLHWVLISGSSSSVACRILEKGTIFCSIVLRDCSRDLQIQYQMWPACWNINSLSISSKYKI